MKKRLFGKIIALCDLISGNSDIILEQIRCDEEYLDYQNQFAKKYKIR